MNQPQLEEPNFFCEHPLNSWYSKTENLEVADLIVDKLAEMRSVNDESHMKPDLAMISDPKLLKNCTQASIVLANFLKQSKKIVICGDYDADGVSASALIVRFLEQIGYKNFAVFIPCRFKQGYGLNENSREEILSLDPECILTVDNGVNAKAEIEFYNARNIFTIITDHHSPDIDNFAPGLVINPKQDGCNYPEKNIAGVTVAYLFLIELRRSLRQINWWENKSLEPNLKLFLDLVLVGTIADCMPLVGLNRILTYYGLKLVNSYLNDTSKRQIPFYLTCIKENITTSLDSEKMNFQIIPLLNASGRIQHASLSFNFLTSNSLIKSKQCFEELLVINNQRKAWQKIMLKTAIKQLDNYVEDQGAAVLFDKTFHEGITGIVAARLVSRLNKPVIILAYKDGVWRGSGRSPQNFNILKFIEPCKKYIRSYGGHPQALGLTIADEELENFVTSFTNPAVEQNCTAENKAIVKTDLEIEKWMLDSYLYHKIKTLEPFGLKNTRPIFLLSGMSLKDPNLRTEKYTRWRLNKQADLVFMKKFLPEFNNGLWDLAGSLFLKEYKGYTYLQFILSDFKLSVNSYSN